MDMAIPKNYDLEQAQPTYIIIAIHSLPLLYSQMI